MALRTAQQYRDGLADGRRVFYRGEQVSDVVAHPELRPAVDHSALAYSIAYCVHTWEMSALRAWVVTFLTFAAAGSASGSWIALAPATVASVMGLLGVWASVWGNELAIRFG